MNHLTTFTKQAAVLLALALPGTALAQSIESRTLTDKIYKGDGVIDLMKDIGGTDLASYFKQTGGLLLLGADVNEDASGNESSKSLGIAIKEARLSIRTTEGDFTFKDFLTSTSAKMREAGSSNEREYATLFGQGGSSQITGSGKLDISKFDDVLWFEDIEYKGRITSASLSISFLPTPNTKPTANESFFDFSGGFEDFALFNVADAVLVEKANIGLAGAPSGVKFDKDDTVVDAIKSALGDDHSGDGHENEDGSTAGNDSNSGSDSTAGNGGNSGNGTNGGTTPVTPPPAAPAPPMSALASLGLLMLWKKRKAANKDNA